MGKGGSVSVKEGNVMSEDAPGNPGAVAWPDDFTASVMVRRMQAKLHRWAGEDPSRCFGDLFNLVYDPAFLVCALQRVAANAGAKTAGIDGVTVAQIKAREGGELEFLAQLRDSLKSGGYRPAGVRQVMIPKGKSGKFRKLGIPTVTDRVVQASLKAVLEPIFEADFKPCSYGFRPNRRSQDAIAEIHQLSSGRSDYHWILEADIKACFDEIDQTALMGRLRVRIKDKRTCGLVKAFLKSGIFTELGDREDYLKSSVDLGFRAIGKCHQIDILRFGAPAGQRLLHPIEGMCYQTFHGTEKSLRYDRMSGLDPEQLDELVWRIEEQLEEPWHKGIGRPKDLSLREAVVVASGYMRQNIIQEVWAEIFDTSQPVISGIIAKFTPLIEESTEEDRPTAEEAEEAVAREQTVLVDGFLAPTWSWRDRPELWSGKHKTTGFNGQVISNLRGDLLFVSEPITGHNHDMTALAETETADIMAAAFSGIGDKGYQGSGFITPFKKPQGGELLDWQKEFNAQVNRLRAPVERAIAHLKSWRILHTDYRRPLRTYATSYRAAVGLYFFKLNFG